MACIESSKRTEEVKLRLTERELLDISRLAAIDERAIDERAVAERAVAEQIVRMLRLSMYGTLNCRAAALQGDCEGLHGSGRGGRARLRYGNAHRTPVVSARYAARPHPARG